MTAIFISKWQLDESTPKKGKLLTTNVLLTSYCSVYYFFPRCYVLKKTNVTAQDKGKRNDSESDINLLLFGITSLPNIDQTLQMLVDRAVYMM